MDEQEYLSQRVEDQIKWYDHKSSWYKNRFMSLKIAETVLALMIPLLAGYIKTEGVELKFTVGLIGVVVAATTNIITLCKFQENWIQYRTVAESLKHEKYLYIAKAGPYKDGGTFPEFVERFENYISKENMQWVSYIKAKKEDK